MKYVANDGTIFDDIDECMEYETKSAWNEFFTAWADQVIMFNSKGERIFANAQELENNFDTIFNTCFWYFMPHTMFPILNKYRNEINNYYDTDIPSFMGYIHYDTENREYISLNDEKNDFILRWIPFVKNIEITTI